MQDQGQRDRFDKYFSQNIVRMLQKKQTKQENRQRQKDAEERKRKKEKKNEREKKLNTQKSLTKRDCEESYRQLWA